MDGGGFEIAHRTRSAAKLRSYPSDISDGSHYEKRGKAEPVCIDDEIPFDIPESWEWVRLGSICDFGKCSNIEYADVAEGTWNLDLEDIEKDTGRVLAKKRKISGDKGSTKHEFKVGMVLYSKLRPYLNKVIIADEDGVCTSEVLPLDFLDLDPRFAQLCLMEPGFIQYAKAHSYGVKMPRLGTDDGKAWLMAIPPINEQRRIVAKVDELVPLVEEYGRLEDAREALDASLPDRLRKSVLQLAVEGKLVEQDPDDEPASVLLERIRKERAHLIKEKKIKAPKGGESVIYRASDGGHYEKRGKSEPVCIDVPFEIPESWEWARLKDFGFFSGGKTPAKHDRSLYGNEILWVTSKDMKAFRIDKTGIKLSKKGAADLTMYPKDTLLFVVRSGILKRFLPIAILEQPATVNQDIKAFRLYEPSIAIYLAYFIKAFEPYILLELTKAVTTVDSICFEDFCNLLIPVPPLAEWLRIRQTLEQTLGEIITNL